MFSLGIPAFHEEVSRMLGDVPIHAWKDYLRLHLVDETPPYLSEAFAQEHFDYHTRHMRGQEEKKERWTRGPDAIAEQDAKRLGKDRVRGGRGERVRVGV